MQQKIENSKLMTILVPVGPGSIFSRKLRINFTFFYIYIFFSILIDQRTNGPVNAHLISWPSKAQNIQNLENIW